MQNIHPLFVHFPIALLFLAVLLDFLGAVSKRESLKSAGWWTLLFGYVASLVTLTTGFFAGNTVPHPESAHEIMELHEHLMVTVVIIFSVLFIWRIILKSKLPEKIWQIVLYFIIAGIGIGILGLGANEGGELVYDHGVGTALVRASGEHHHHSHNEAAESEEHHHEDAELEEGHHSHHEESVSADTAACPYGMSDKMMDKGQCPYMTSDIEDTESASSSVHKHKDGSMHTH